LNSNDTAILDSVWSVFLRVAAGYPNDDVAITLQSRLKFASRRHLSD
jgi:hypothetical protein